MSRFVCLSHSSGAGFARSRSRLATFLAIMTCKDHSFNLSDGFPVSTTILPGFVFVVIGIVAFALSFLLTIKTLFLSKNLDILMTSPFIRIKNPLEMILMGFKCI